MTAMDLDTLTWSQRGRWVSLLPMQVYAVLQGVNDDIVAANRRVAATGGNSKMRGIGFADRTEQIQDAAHGLALINSYVSDLPSDVAQRLDQPLFEAFANGPAEALSLIRADDLTTANTPGAIEHVMSTGPGGTYETDSTPAVLALEDFTGASDHGMSVDPLFAEVFSESHQS